MEKLVIKGYHNNKIRLIGVLLCLCLIFGMEGIIKW